MFVCASVCLYISYLQVDFGSEGNMYTLLLLFMGELLVHYDIPSLKLDVSCLT